MSMRNYTLENYFGKDNDENSNPKKHRRKHKGFEDSDFNSSSSSSDSSSEEYYIKYVTQIPKTKPKVHKKSLHPNITRIYQKKKKPSKDVKKKIFDDDLNDLPNDLPPPLVIQTPLSSNEEVDNEVRKDVSESVNNLLKDETCRSPIRLSWEINNRPPSPRTFRVLTPPQSPQSSQLSELEIPFMDDQEYWEFMRPSLDDFNSQNDSEEDIYDAGTYYLKKLEKRFK